MDNNQIIAQNRSSYGEYQESKQLSEIKGKMFLAREFPRDEERALQRVLSECARKELAEQAQYEFPRGDSVVRGPSIRLVEVLARHWGNLTFGVSDLEVKKGETTVKAYAWDLETNVSDEKTFTVKHERTTKKASYALTDPRDIYEATANNAARRKRACILAVLPGWYVDAAIEACDKTLSAAIAKDGKSMDEIVKAITDAFAEYGVTPEHISAKLNKEIDKLDNNDVVKLRKLYAAIKDGFVKPQDAFEMGSDPSAPALAEDEASALNALNARLGKGEQKTAYTDGEEGKLPWEK